MALRRPLGLLSPIIGSTLSPHHDDDAFNGRRCRALRRACNRCGYTLVRMSDSDFCAVRAVGIKLSNRIATAWRRGKTKANRLLSNPPPEIRTTHECTTHETTSPPPPSFPYDIVEMIIAHLIRHRNTLEACSLACRSWYTVAAPHLHHTLTLMGNNPGVDRSRLEPLSKLLELGLVPLVREIRVKQRFGSVPWFVPLVFNRSDLGYFSAFANVHTLNIENMQIYRFMPGIERYFEHFSPTLRSITLSELYCAPRQLARFLSLFSNLDDVEIRNTHRYMPNATVPDPKPVPSSPPKLRGRLTLHHSSWAETWTHLITLSDGLRFRHMDLLNVGRCGPVLLEVCAETLETLRVGARDDSVSE